MAIFGTISILNKLPRQKKIGGIVIDGYLEETHIRKSKVTRYPIEQGSDITDHIKNDPDGVIINGVVTNTPLLTSVILGVPLGDRVTEVLQALERIRSEKQLVSVVTSLKVYNNMAIEDFAPVKNTTTGQSMEFSITLTNVIKVTNQTTTIPNEIIGGDENTEQRLAQNNIDQGQTVGTSSPITDTNLQTILADITAQLGGL